MLYAKNSKELRKMIKQNPDEYPSTFLSDDSFASACFDSKTIKELKSAFNRDAEPDDCIKWGISSNEWKENIEMALIALKSIV